MKAKFAITFICMLLAASVYAGCGESTWSSGGCTSCPTCGGCGDDYYDNTCQCTDPACYSSYDRGCLSKSSCCEAFGNVGAR